MYIDDEKPFIPNKQIILELESARVQDMLIRGRNILCMIKMEK